MRVYISCDMEGIGGVTSWEQVSQDGKDYQRFRELMTAEVQEAALGAFDAGAKVVVVNDAHGNMRNIVIEKLDPRIQLISGPLKPLGMVQGIEDGFDAGFFIGYHAGAGTRKAICDHTFSSSIISEVRINGVKMTETTINALIAGYYNTPIVLVSGDEETCRGAKKALGNCETVIVKWAISRFSARSLHPQEVRRLLRESARRCLKNLTRFKPYKIPPPYKLYVKMLATAMADSAEVMPGARRIEPLAIEYNAKDLLEIYRALETLILLGWYATK